MQRVGAHPHQPRAGAPAIIVRVIRAQPPRTFCRAPTRDFARRHVPPLAWIRLFSSVRCCGLGARRRSCIMETRLCLRGMRGTHAWRKGIALTVIAAIVPCAIALLPVATAAAAVRVRYPEGTAHAVLALTDTKGATLAHGELIQWAERRGAMASRLVFRFNDGSIYDELVRFAQQPVLRLLSYKLVQRGPSFSESSDISFDRSGRYRARVRESPEQDEKEAAGSIEIPEDVSNGMTSLFLKNLPPGTSGLTHLIAFTPKPQILELHLTPQGTERCFVGATAVPVTRFLLQPRVTGVKGVLAGIVGKQPPSFQMWLTPDPAPALLRFEGPLYADGPTWRIGAAAPTWKE